MSVAQSSTPLKRRTCGFCLFKLPSEDSFIGDSEQIIQQSMPTLDGHFWIQYIECRDDWIDRQLELTNGDLRILGHRECDTCSGLRGCGWCISNSRSTIPLLSRRRDELSPDDSMDKETSSLDEDTWTSDEEISSPVEHISSLDEDTAIPAGKRLATKEDILSMWNSGDISSLHQETHSPPNYEFPLQAFQQSGKRGCENCRKLTYYFLPFLDLWPRRINCGMLSWQNGQLRWRLMEEGEDREGETWTIFCERRFNICSFRQEEKVHPLEKVMKELPQYTGSLLSFDQLSAWVKFCTNHHSKCGTGSNTVLPTRVLSIKRGLEEPHVQLVNGAGVMGKYICLSHSWGSGSSARPLCLLLAHKSSFEQEIPWLSIPKTFQDVLMVVHRLGIQFLWIDSLCIVQEDDDDWHREAAAMSQYYQNSWLTIAATISADSSQGLYSFMDNLLDAKELSGSKFIRASLEHPFPPNKWDDKTFPLLSRGWVYQERLLSPRVVHFTKDELIFECREGFWCECGIYKSLEHNKITPKYSYNQTLLNGGSSSPERWHEIVSAYSRLSLSFAKDKLPAISGIAKQLEYASNGKLGDYLAGLWEKNIEFDLLWYSTNRLGVCDRPHPRPAPSWSWASIKGEVNFEKLVNLRLSGQKKVRLLGHKISSTGPDNYGQLKWAHLTVSGLIATGSLAYGSNKDEGTIWEELRLQDISLKFTPDYSLRTPGDAFVPPGEVFFLMMGVDFNPTQEDPPYSLFLGLHCVDRSLNYFERIGIGYAPKIHFDDEWIRAWAQRRTITLV